MHLRVVVTIAPAWLFAGATLADPPVPPPAPVAAPATVVLVQTQVPPAFDGCLDHTVKELGMSAKRADGPARHWDIAPKFLHGVLQKDGAAALTVDLDKTDKAARVSVRAAWSGAAKDKATQGEIEERLRLMAAKMAQQCGVTKAELTCTTTPAGGTAAPCLPPPTP